MKPIRIGESLQFGWHTLHKRSALVFQVVLSIFALQVALEVVSRVLRHTGVGMLAMLVLVLLLLMTGVGATVITLKLVRKEKVAYADILPSVTLVGRFIFAAVLVAALSLVPLLVGMFLALFALISADPTYTQDVPMIFVHSNPSVYIFPVLTIVGGLFVAAHVLLRFAMVRFAIIDGAGVLESLRLSTRLMQGNKWQLLGFVVVAVALNIVGALCLLVGLLVTIPITVLAYAHIYQKLKESVEEKA